MHYKYYYYSRDQLLASEKTVIQRPLVTIACEALLMVMMMSALCKHTHKHTGMFEGSYEIKQEILACLI